MHMHIYMIAFWMEARIENKFTQLRTFTLNFCFSLNLPDIFLHVLRLTKAVVVSLCKPLLSNLKCMLACMAMHGQLANLDPGLQKFAVHAIVMVQMLDH